MSGCAHMSPDDFCASCAGEKLVAARDELVELRAENARLRAENEKLHRNIDINLEELEQAEAEVERLRALDRANVAMLQGEVEERERYKSRMVQAEAKLEIAQACNRRQFDRAEQAEGRLAKVVDDSAHLAWKLLHEMHEDAAASVVSEAIRALTAQPEEESRG